MERMILPPRLAQLASWVPTGARLVDVGTDHGKLPIALLTQKRIASAIGTDIHAGPLAHAARNAQACGVSLPLRHAPGLEAIQPEECDTITIAGMGGQTILSILIAAPWTATGAHQLLLQPMTRIYELRQGLYAHGYTIERELPCCEDRRWYLILAVRGGGQPQDVPLLACLAPPTLLYADHALDYLRYIHCREWRILQGMQQSRVVTAVQRAEQQAIVDQIDSALACISASGPASALASVPTSIADGDNPNMTEA